MLSEWLVDVPDDLEDEWLMVICPTGRRNLVIASNVGTLWNILAIAMMARMMMMILMIALTNMMTI